LGSSKWFYDVTAAAQKESTTTQLEITRKDFGFNNTLYSPIKPEVLAARGGNSPHISLANTMFENGSHLRNSPAASTW
jgi:hypothetical protein